jgi:hypothetical protein
MDATAVITVIHAKSLAKQLNLYHVLRNGNIAECCDASDDATYAVNAGNGIRRIAKHRSLSLSLFERLPSLR